MGSFIYPLAYSDAVTKTTNNTVDAVWYAMRYVGFNGRKIVDGYKYSVLSSGQSVPTEPVVVNTTAGITVDGQVINFGDYVLWIFHHGWAPYVVMPPADFVAGYGPHPELDNGQ